MREMDHKTNFIPTYSCMVDKIKHNTIALSKVHVIDYFNKYNVRKILCHIIIIKLRGSVYITTGKVSHNQASRSDIRVSI